MDKTIEQLLRKHPIPENKRRLYEEYIGKEPKRAYFSGWFDGWIAAWRNAEKEQQEPFQEGTEAELLSAGKEYEHLLDLIRNDIRAMECTCKEEGFILQPEDITVTLSSSFRNTLFHLQDKAYEEMHIYRVFPVYDNVWKGDVKYVGTIDDVPLFESRVQRDKWIVSLSNSPSAVLISSYLSMALTKSYGLKKSEALFKATPEMQSAAFKTPLHMPIIPDEEECTIPSSLMVPVRRDITVQVALDKGATLPEYRTTGAVGADICALNEVIILPGQQKLIDTGIHVKVPEGCELQIRQRSGLAILPATIGQDFRGSIKVLLRNEQKDKRVVIARGTPVAWMVLSPVYHIKWEQKAFLDGTEHGAGGFGHTGVK